MMNTSSPRTEQPRNMNAHPCADVTRTGRGVGGPYVFQHSSRHCCTFRGRHGRAECLSVRQSARSARDAKTRLCARVSLPQRAADAGEHTEYLCQSHWSLCEAAATAVTSARDTQHNVRVTCLGGCARAAAAAAAPGSADAARLWFSAPHQQFISFGPWDFD
jgi:hypothetical protein